MAAKEHTFDLSAKVDMQEMKNALEQAKKEVQARYDFKADKVKEIQLNEKEKTITLIASSENKINAIKDILDSKLSKRSIPLKTLKEDKRESASGGNVRVVFIIRDTLSSDEIKTIHNLMKKSNIKVTCNTMGDEIRFKSKSIDELQAAIAYLKGADLEFPLHFSNFK